MSSSENNPSPARSFLASLGGYIKDPKRRAAVDKHNTQFGRQGDPKAPGDHRHPHAAPPPHQEVGGVPPGAPLPTQKPHGEAVAQGILGKQTMMMMLRRAAEVRDGLDIPKWLAMDEMSTKEVDEHFTRVFGQGAHTYFKENLPQRPKGYNFRAEDVSDEIIEGALENKGSAPDRKEPKEDREPKERVEPKKPVKGAQGRTPEQIAEDAKAAREKARRRNEEARDKAEQRGQAREAMLERNRAKREREGEEAQADAQKKREEIIRRRREEVARARFEQEQEQEARLKAQQEAVPSEWRGLSPLKDAGDRGILDEVRTLALEHDEVDATESKMSEITAATKELVSEADPSKDEWLGSMSPGGTEGSFGTYGIFDEETGTVVASYLTKSMDQMGLSEVIAGELSKEANIPQMYPEVKRVGDSAIMEIVPGKDLQEHGEVYAQYDTATLAQFKHYMMQGLDEGEAARRATVDVQTASMLDLLLMNGDRNINPGNVMYDPESGRITSIDNGYIFSSSYGIDFEDLEESIKTYVKNKFGRLGYQGLKPSEVLPEAVENIMNIDPQTIQDIIDEAIGELPGTAFADDRSPLMNFLINRDKNVVKYIQAIRNALIEYLSEELENYA